MLSASMEMEQWLKTDQQILLVKYMVAKTLNVNTFNTPWKHQKISGFLMFSGDKKRPVSWYGLVKKENMLSIKTKISCSWYWKLTLESAIILFLQIYASYHIPEMIYTLRRYSHIASDIYYDNSHFKPKHYAKI